MRQKKEGETERKCKGRKGKRKRREGLGKENGWKGKGGSVRGINWKGLETMEWTGKGKKG